MAAILPTGMRAISTEISPETGAGGFILPNDRVDVILSRREKDADNAGGDPSTPRPFLAMCAFSRSTRRIEEKNGQKVVVGKTATLELKPEQAETLARVAPDAERCRWRCAASPTPTRRKATTDDRSRATASMSFVTAFRRQTTVQK